MYNALVPYVFALQTIEIINQRSLIINCITMTSESLQRLFDYILYILYNDNIYSNYILSII